MLNITTIKKPRRLTPEQIRDIKDSVRKGMRQIDISRAMGIKENVVSYWANKTRPLRATNDTIANTISRVEAITQKGAGYAWVNEHYPQDIFPSLSAGIRKMLAWAYESGRKAGEKDE